MTRADRQRGVLALLSQALVAFTMEVDDALEVRMPHRTTNGGSASAVRGAPSLVASAMWFNCMRFISDAGVTVGEVERRARTPTNLDGTRRWGFVSIAGGRRPALCRNEAGSSSASAIASSISTSLRPCSIMSILNRARVSGSSSKGRAQKAAARAVRSRSASSSVARTPATSRAVSGCAYTPDVASRRAPIDIGVRCWG
jgi:hypothetical protein